MRVEDLTQIAGRNGVEAGGLALAQAICREFNWAEIAHEHNPLDDGGICLFFWHQTSNRELTVFMPPDGRYAFWVCEEEDPLTNDTRDIHTAKNAEPALMRQWLMTGEAFWESA